MPDDKVARGVEAFEQPPKAAQGASLVQVEHHRLAFAPEQPAVDDLFALFDDDAYGQDAAEIAVEREAAELFIRTRDDLLQDAGRRIRLIRGKGFYIYENPPDHF